MKKGKKEFKAELKNLTETTADLYLFGEIVGSEWERWTNEDMAPETFRQLLEEANGKNLNVYINSGGGSVFGGLAIYNQLKRYKGKKTVYVDGLAGSIASIIAFGGDRLVIPSNAYLMIHKPWVSTYGNATDLRKMANTLDRIEEGLLNVYAENLKDGVDISQIKTMVAQETWLNGSKAADYFNIEVTDSLEAVATVKGDWFNSYQNAPNDILDTETQSNDTLPIPVDNNTQNEIDEPKTANLKGENDGQPTDDPKNEEIGAHNDILEKEKEEKEKLEIENLLLEIELL